MKQIFAKFDGTCRKCNKSFDAGEQINWDKQEGSSHVECPPPTKSSLDDPFWFIHQLWNHRDNDQYRSWITKGLYPKLHYGAAPIGWREISEKEFVGSAFFNEFPDLMIAHSHQEICQNQDGTPLKKIKAHLFYFREVNGYAIARDPVNKCVKYYKFGCAHVDRSLSDGESEKLGLYIGPCQNNYVCIKCGHTRSIDSSD